MWQILCLPILILACTTETLKFVQTISRIQKESQWPKVVFASTGKNRKDRVARAIKELNGTLNLWLSVRSMDEHVLTEIKRKNIKSYQMLGISETFNELGMPTTSELIWDFVHGDSFDRHLRSMAGLMDAEVSTIVAYSFIT